MEVSGYGVEAVEIITPELTSARAHTHVFITFTHIPLSSSGSSQHSLFHFVSFCGKGVRRAL